jgi:hypothetical protein
MKGEVSGNWLKRISHFARDSPGYPERMKPVDLVPALQEKSFRIVF